MKEQIRIGILGYGNLGKGVECAVKQNDDMKLAAVFTRRSPESLKILTEGVPVYSAEMQQHMQRKWMYSFFAEEAPQTFQHRLLKW